MKYYVIPLDDIKDEKVLEYLKVYGRLVDKTEKKVEVKVKKNAKDFKFKIDGFNVIKDK